MKQNEKVVIGWVTAGTIYNEFAMSIMDIIRMRDERIWGFGSVTGPYISSNRHNLVTEFLETDADWLLMMDTDVVITLDDFDALIKTADSEKYPVLSGKYFFHFEGDPVPFKVSAQNRNGFLENYEQDTVVENLMSVGCGYLLVHRSAYETVRTENPKSPSPWFWNGLEQDGMLQSEDSYLCAQFRHCGIPISLYTGASSKHVGKMAVTEKHFLSQ